MKAKHTSFTNISNKATNKSHSIKRVLKWWGKHVPLVEQRKGLVGKFPIALYVKKCPDSKPVHLEYYKAMTVKRCEAQAQVLVETRPLLENY